MFLYFFEDYKEKVYKGSRRKLMWYEIIMIVFMFLSMFLFLLSSISGWNNAVKIVLFSVLLLSVIIVWIYTNIMFKKNRNSLLANYRDKHINGLINLLEFYNIHNIEGINWLIECCNGKKTTNNYTNLAKPIKTLFLTIVYPLINLGLGLVLKESTTEEVFTFIVLIIILFIIVAGLIFSLKPIISFVLFPDSNIINYLEDDLQYVKTQIIK